jgi:CTP:phosphocholine cytidylyltransferase-like protein
MTANKAIILAAGLGSRLSPVTDKIPKPLIEVNGRRLIETLIDGFIEHSIPEIYVVTGHLKERFEYLPLKYRQVKLLENPHYNTSNNISSLYAAREYLGDCIITDGDLFIHNTEILNPLFDVSGYCSVWAEETDEWLQATDKDGVVLSCCRTGGKNGWQLFSISFWTKEDGEKLKHHLTKEFEKGNKDIYWDDVPMFLHKNEYRLKIKKIDRGDVSEIDSLDELIALDVGYAKYKESL